MLGRWKLVTGVLLALAAAAILSFRTIADGSLAEVTKRPDAVVAVEGIEVEELSDEVFTSKMEEVDFAFSTTAPRTNATQKPAFVDIPEPGPQGEDLVHMHSRDPQKNASEVAEPGPPTWSALAVSQIQFVVMSSKLLRFKAHLVHRTWCAIPGARCLFVVDGYFGDGRGHNLEPMLKVPRVRSINTRSCCKGGKGFFCGRHRQETLPAQYRFLPALNHAKNLEGVRNGEVRWVIVVDDDSFVFMGNLVRLLASLDSRKAVYFGDFHPGREVVCGGSGSVFSVTALQQMDIGRCISAMHHMCMQSDWMFGECARRGGVGLLKQYTCGTCAGGNRKWPDRIAKNLGHCHFMQVVEPFLDRVPLEHSHTPSIIHGIPPDKLYDTFYRLMATAAANVSAVGLPGRRHG